MSFSNANRVGRRRTRHGVVASLLIVMGAACTDVESVTSAPPTVERVRLDQTSTRLREGAVTSFHATALDAEGAEVSGVEMAWRTLDDDIASVTPDGRVTGVRVGATRVIAEARGRSDTADVTVLGIPGLSHDLVYGTLAGEVGVGSRLFSLDIRQAVGQPRALFAIDNAEDVSPSPDEQRLAVVVRTGGRAAIMIMDRTGQHAMTVADGYGGNDQPAWSPDGTRIAFRRWSGGAAPGPLNPADVWVVNADGTMPRNLTADLDLEVSASHPTWSPEPPYGTQRIAFGAEWVAGGRMRGMLYSMDADGGDKRRITAPAYAADREPTWSPLGHSLVFVREGLAGDSELMMATVGDNGELIAERPLFSAPLPGAQRSPVWAPDGRLIAFVSAHRPQAGGALMQIWTVWLDGTKLAQRTFDDGDKQRPGWIMRAP